MIYCVLQRNVEVVLHVKKCGVEIPKMWIVYNFVKKFTRFIFFVSIFRFICESDFSKMQSIRFSAMKIHRNAVKIIVFDGNTEISTVEIELLLACADNMGHYFST